MERRYVNEGFSESFGYLWLVCYFMTDCRVCMFDYYFTVSVEFVP